MSGFHTVEEVQFTYDSLVQAGAVSRVSDCIQYGSNPAKYSYIRKRVASDRVVRESVHRIALLIKLKATAIPKELEASHLCHMMACINPEHLSAEPHDINQSRIKCYNESERLGYAYCLRNHGEYPACV